MRPGVDPPLQLMEYGAQAQRAFHVAKRILRTGQEDIGAPEFLGVQVGTVASQQIGPIKFLALAYLDASTAHSIFLQDHLGRWAGSFSNRLLHTTGKPLYVTAAHLLLATISFAADELKVEEIQPLEVRELPVEPDAVDCPMACPEVSGLVQSQSLTETD